ncbi:MAG: NUDIX domain-containing protein [Simkania negevensis]|nr:NUDIX domain-containing protein [Simkania negevensis]
MIQERCFGIIPLTFRDNLWEVFIMQHFNGGHWSFPKGHAMKGESPKETAARELLEETGMVVLRFLDFPYLTDRYLFHKEKLLHDKTVRYYLAEVNPSHLPASKEMIQGKWLLLKELPSYASYKETKILFEKLVTMLSK